MEQEEERGIYISFKNKYVTEENCVKNCWRGLFKPNVLPTLSSSFTPSSHSSHPNTSGEFATSSLLNNWAD